MSRISSQGAVIMINNPAVPPDSLAVVSATKAKPTVITLAVGTAPVVGDLVVPVGTGWKSIDDRPFRVSAVAGQAITLEDSDTSAEVPAINVAATSKVNFYTDTGSLLELCRSTFNLNQPAGATIDVTTLCDDAHRIVAGLPAVGTWTAAGFYDANDTALVVARDAYRAGSDVIIAVIFRDGSGVSFAGTVNQLDLTMGINAAVANTLGGNVDGVVSWSKTVPPGFVPLLEAA